MKEEGWRFTSALRLCQTRFVTSVNTFSERAPVQRPRRSANVADDVFMQLLGDGSTGGCQITAGRATAAAVCFP